MVLKPALPKVFDSQPVPKEKQFEHVLQKANRSIAKSKSRVLLSRLDQLKFRMQMQNRNLKLLTD